MGLEDNYFTRLSDFKGRSALILRTSPRKDSLFNECRLFFSDTAEAVTFKEVKLTPIPTPKGTETGRRIRTHLSEAPLTQESQKEPNPPVKPDKEPAVTYLKGMLKHAEVCGEENIQLDWIKANLQSALELGVINGEFHKQICALRNYATSREGQGKTMLSKSFFLQELKLVLAAAPKIGTRASRRGSPYLSKAVPRPGRANRKLSLGMG